MDRRAALKAIGVLTICLGGSVVYEAKASESIASVDWNKPVDYCFSADGIKNLIIERKGKPDLVIPFSEIVKALEGREK